MRRSIALALTVCGCLVATSAASGRVLLVGTYHGVRGQYASIQKAVNAARPGDWILIGPGDYKTTSSRAPAGNADSPAGILISKRGLHIRGMNRGAVIIDGTKPGFGVCSDKPKAQNFGPRGKGGDLGLNGIMVWKADNVSIQNVTVCNFLGGAGGDGGTGNEIWWNGGANSAKIGGWGYLGSYLTATSTWFDPDTKLTEKQREVTAAEYGIFSSNWSGGTWYDTYASNMNDSGYYIGACQQQCDQTINKAWGEYSALGYSGSNSGGWMLIENSRFDGNEDGFDTNSQNGDNPPPQNGACPAGVKPPVNGAAPGSCWVFIHNTVIDNNNPNVPAAGSAAAGPVGTGMSISGGRNDTVLDNTFQDNDAWGVIVVPYLDSGPPCTGGTLNALGAGSCLYDEFGDAILGNTFIDDGSYGHPSNGDYAQVNFEAGPTDCYAANRDAGGAIHPPDAAAMELSHPVCNGQVVPRGSSDPNFLSEVLCDSQVELSPGTPSPCPSGPYPRLNPAKLVDGLHPLPRHLVSMPNPCAGVPSNPWCSRRR